MSRILRRPMFRGGKVIDSRGTGITSGLMDGGRVGYSTAGVVTGGSLLDKAKGLFLGPYFNDPNFKPPSIAVPKGGGFEFLSPKIQSKGLEKIGEGVDERTPRLDELGIDEIAKPVTYGRSQEKAMEAADLEVGEGDLNLTEEDKKGLNEFYKTLDIKEKVEDYKGGVPDKTINTGPTGNRTIEPKISAEDAIRQNAELFKELLGEASKEDIKKARIQDASDYLLKFFAGTQKEGADVGSAAAEVAEFAVSRDSRTDRAKEAQKKTDQTATALAINDYIAGKRSKEEINKLLAGYAAKAEFAKGDTASQIADFAGKQGYLPGVDIIKTYIRDDKALRGKEIVEFDSTKENVSYTTGDENKVFIDKITKRVFTYNKDGLPIPIAG